MGEPDPAAGDGVNDHEGVGLPRYLRGTVRARVGCRDVVICLEGNRQRIATPAEVQLLDLLEESRKPVRQRSKLHKRRVEFVLGR